MALAATIVVSVLAAFACASALAAKGSGGKLEISSLASGPEHVTGGDALLAVHVPKGVKASKVEIRRDGANVTKSFDPARGSKDRLVGVVGGLKNGGNLITAFGPGARKPASLELYNSSISGPIISGPQQSPFICRTVDAGLGASTDADCSAPTQVTYRYKATNGNYKPIADPAIRPADIVQTTTRDGQTVDFMVRIESGVINRSIYRWAILAPGGQLGTAWNHRLVYQFGGGCSAGHEQGNSAVGSVLDDRELAQGYSVLAGSLTVLGTACNDVLSAETVSMIKEHVIESLGEAPAWTIGEGGSGGSIQAQMIGQNYPGLLDGLLPTASFPDNTAPDYPDCRLLNSYFETPDGSALTDAQRQAITGLATPSGCSALGAGADVVNASEGCQESIVPQAIIFDPATNPGGIRCTIWDSMINIYGADPATGYARRALDNTGVQYGLVALASGELSLGEFLDLNEGIGGFDNNGRPQAGRSVADSEALAIAYRTGRINQGAGGIPDVPIIDARSYVDDEVNVHQSLNGYKFRARLDQTNGGHGNQVMFRASGGPNVDAMQTAALNLMGSWLDAIEGDKSNEPLSQKVLANKPADAVDACWMNGGVRTNDPAVIGSGGPCETRYPPQSLPAQQAGKPVGSIVTKCRLKAVDPSAYGSPGPVQTARLVSIFPGGVCDWTRPGVGQQKLGGTWFEFGPERNVKRHNRSLKLSVRENGSGRNARTELSARLGPCPKVSLQPVVVEQKMKKGWRKVGSAVTEGRKCKAVTTVRVQGGKPVKLRARAEAVGPYRSVKSKSKRA